MTEKIQCSVNILSYNNEDTIEQCLNSVKNFDEIVVNDGGSSDRTLEICRKYDCTIIQQDKSFKRSDNTIKHFSALRNQIIDYSKNNWIFIIDTDESIPIETTYEIDDIIKKKSDTKLVFRMARKYIVNSEIIDNCISYPSWQIRLFRKDSVHGYENELHEIVKVKKVLL